MLSDSLLTLALALPLLSLALLALRARSVARRLAELKARPRRTYAAGSAAEELLATLRQQHGVDMPLPSGGESVNELCERFLRARYGNVAAAAEMLAADTRWRHTMRCAALVGQTAEEVLGCTTAQREKLDTILPVASVGHDRQGRPVVFKHFGAGCTLGVALDTHSLEALSRYNVWLNEGFSQRLAERRAHQWSIVIDALGWHPRLATPRAMGVLQDMATIDALHYPERLAAIVVVNAPALLATTWAVISSWLGEATRRKVQILSVRRPDAARAVLLEMIAPEQLPRQYGGDSPPLEPWPEASGFHGG